LTARIVELARGPWRAVPALGLIQILAWGAMFFPPVLTVPVIAAERGWSTAFGMAGFSTALIVAGLASPRMGRLVDRHGGHVVMPVGALIGALGLTLMVLTSSGGGWLVAWAIVGVAMAACLYDAAFATMGRIFGAGARRAITWLTLVSGIASTISWPATHYLVGHAGPRTTYLIYAAVLAFVVAPLGRFGLPRMRAAGAAPGRSAEAHKAPAVYEPRGLPFFLVASAFSAFAFVHAGMNAHLIAMFSRLGLDLGTAVALGAISGPMQIATRIVEIAFGRGTHPLWMARGAMTLLLCAYVVLGLFGVSALSVAAFFVLFGMANGIFTIARGMLPLVLFGPAGYGHVIGRLALPFLATQAVAPISLALVIDRTSDVVALWVLTLFAALSLGCFAMLRRPAGAGS
jgi:MFS family permease